MRLPFDIFEGMAPRIDPAGLAGGLAKNAVNAGFSKGFLAATPLDFSEISLSDLKPTQVNTGGFTRAGGLFYSHMADAWFIWPSGVDVIRGVDSLIAPQDLWSRIYFSDQNGPRFLTSDQYTANAVNYNPTSYRLGIPAPAGTPSVNKDSEDIPSDVDDDDVVRQRITYRYTLVDNYGHEGPPSSATSAILVPVEYDFQATVTLPLGATDLTGRAFSGSVARKRIYRSAQGTDLASYFFIGEVDFSSDTFVDTVPYGEESELMVSINWDMPPAGMTEIAAVASNFLAGYVGNLICYTPPKLPHAWPLDYRFPLKYQIVGIMPTANGLFIGTTGKPYWGFGADPEAAIPVEIDQDFPCVSKDSIVDVGGFVMYATHDGIVAMNGQEAVLLSDPIFSRMDWQALEPETIKAFAYEGRYFFYSRQAHKLYALRPDDPRTMTEITWTGSPTLFDHLVATERSLRYDRTVLAFSLSSTVALMEIVNEYAAEVEWESRLQKTPPVRFNFARVRGTAFPVMLTVTGSDNPSYSVVVTDENPVRITFPGKSRLWGIKLEFNGSEGDVIRDVVLTQGSGEFTDGT